MLQEDATFSLSESVFTLRFEFIYLGSSTVNPIRLISSAGEANIRWGWGNNTKMESRSIPHIFDIKVHGIHEDVGACQQNGTSNILSPFQKREMQYNALGLNLDA